MFGNILIDKLKFNIQETEAGYDYKKLENRIKKILLENFEENAVHVSRSYHELKVNITPTRFKVQKYYTDVNLEMISKRRLRTIFNQLGLPEEIISKARIVEIHLTKNIIVNEETVKYINYLGQRKYKHLYPFIHSSNKEVQTLYLSTPANNSNKKDYTGDRKFLFYDKSAYLIEKGKNFVALKTPLKESEKDMLTTTKIHTNSLYMNEINVLRIELQYKNSGKIRKIANFIDGKKSYTEFPLHLFLKQLSKGTLYKNLEKFYTKELEKYVFFDKVNNETPESSTRLNGLFQELISRADNIDILQSLYGASHKGEFRKLMREVQTKIVHSFYKELYEKLAI